MAFLRSTAVTMQLVVTRWDFAHCSKKYFDHSRSRPCVPHVYPTPRLRFAPTFPFALRPGSLDYLLVNLLTRTLPWETFYARVAIPVKRFGGLYQPGGKCSTPPC